MSSSSIALLLVFIGNVFLYCFIIVKCNKKKKTPLNNHHLPNDVEVDAGVGMRGYFGRQWTNRMAPEKFNRSQFAYKLGRQ